MKRQMIGFTCGALAVLAMASSAWAAKTVTWTVAAGETKTFTDMVNGGADVVAGDTIIKKGPGVLRVDSDHKIKCTVTVEEGVFHVTGLKMGNGGTVTVQLHAAKASLSPVRDGGEAAVRITVRVRAGVTESSGADTADREMLALLEDELSRAVTAQIEAAAEASRTLDADFLELWRILPEVKNDGVLAALRADVQTESTLERSYDIYGSAHGKEKPHG